MKKKKFDFALKINEKKTHHKLGTMRQKLNTRPEMHCYTMSDKEHTS